MAHRDGVVLDVDERPEFGQWVGLSLQHMFSMFGSTVLVPILVGLNPGIALFSSGVGTLMYLLITRHKIPAYMGSSFSFIVPMMGIDEINGLPRDCSRYDRGWLCVLTGIADRYDDWLGLD